MMLYCCQQQPAVWLQGCGRPRRVGRPGALNDGSWLQPGRAQQRNSRGAACRWQREHRRAPAEGQLHVGVQCPRQGRRAIRVHHLRGAAEPGRAVRAARQRHIHDHTVEAADEVVHQLLAQLSSQVRHHSNHHLSESMLFLLSLMLVEKWDIFLINNYCAAVFWWVIQAAFFFCDLRIHFKAFAINHFSHSIGFG